MYEARLAAIQMEFRAGTERYRQHALDQMAARGPLLADYEQAMASGDLEVIEDYQVYDPAAPEYPPSMLVIGWIGGVAFHTVVTYPPQPIVITVYPPQTEPDKWTPDYRRRRRG